MANCLYLENAELIMNHNINEAEFVNFLKKLKNKKSCGVDGISNEILKQPSIKQLLLSFMNMCFKYNIIPSLWTQSIIKPIPGHIVCQYNIRNTLPLVTEKFCQGPMCPIKL